MCSTNFCWPFNAFRSRENVRQFPDDLFNWIFLNENIWILIKTSFKFISKGPINNISAMVQIMAWHRPGDKPLSEHMVFSLLTHICVTRSQWVKLCLLADITRSLNNQEGAYCPACRTSLIATRFWVVMICPIIKCLTVLEFSFILFDLCLFITIFNFILNYVPIVKFWIFTYHKIWSLLIIFCFIWSYWIIYFLTCLEVFWSVVS